LEGCRFRGEKRRPSLQINIPATPAKAIRTKPWEQASFVIVNSCRAYYKHKLGKTGKSVKDFDMEGKKKDY
jgi:hypothetical protein